MEPSLNTLKKVLRTFLSKVFDVKFNIFVKSAEELATFIRETPELKRRIYREVARKQLEQRREVLNDRKDSISDDDIDYFLLKNYDSVKPEAEKRIEGLCKFAMSYNWKAITGAVSVIAFCFFPALCVLIRLFLTTPPPSGLPSNAEIAIAALPIAFLLIASLVTFLWPGKQKK